MQRANDTLSSIPKFHFILISFTHIIYVHIIKSKEVPSKEDGNNALIARASDAKERRHGHVKVLSRRVAPPSLVVRRAKVGGSHRDPAYPKAPLRVSPVVAPDLVASPTCLTLPEQHLAQCRRVDSEPCMDCAVVPTRSP